MGRREYLVFSQIPAGDGMVLDKGRRGTGSVPEFHGSGATPASVGETPLHSHLLAGERFIWTGVPRRGVVFGPQDVFLVPFSLFWCGFSIFWVIGASHAGGAFGLFGLPFVAIGLFLVFGRFIVDAWLRSRTTYAVTDRRILIHRAAPFASFTSIDLLRIPEVKLSGVKGDRGTLRFGPQDSSLQRGNIAMSVTSLDPTPQFIEIERPNEVLRLILEASEEGRSPGRQPSC